MTIEARKIPSPVISVLSEHMSEIETHASIDNLFLYADAPDEIPDGSKREKVTMWLRQTNKKSEFPLTVLGLLIEEYMEYEAPSEPTQLNSWMVSKVGDPRKTLQEKLINALKRGNLAYLSEGKIVDLTSQLENADSGRSNQELPNTSPIVGNVIPPTIKVKAPLKNKVFIVHGRDNEAKQEVARFIEKQGLEAIILHEQVNGGMSIIQKIEHYSQEAGYAVILYTPCDKGRGYFENNVVPKKRARQNVVFEHGYLMAKLGPENICTLVKDDEIETPNDISGIVYEHMDTAGAWKQKLKNELEACGYNVK